MKLSKENRDALLMQAHQIIKESVDFTIEVLNNPKKDLEYFAFKDDEEKYINKDSELLREIIRKVLVRNLDEAFFNFLCVIDGVTEPKIEFGKKSDVLLIDKPEDFNDHYDFLHDHFYELYDSWIKTNN